MDVLKVYSSTIYKKDIRYLNQLFNKLEQPEVPEPKQNFTKPTPTTFKSAVYTKRIKNWIKAMDGLDSTLRSLFNIVWDQCNKLIQNKLKSSITFEAMDINRDVTWLLKEIRSISHQLEASISLYDSVDEVKRAYYLYK